MAFEIEVKDEAKRDISDAMQWYVSKAETLDKKFLLAVEETLLRIKQNLLSSTGASLRETLLFDFEAEN